MAGSNNTIQGSLLIFDGKLFDDWKVKMLAIFGFQDVFEGKEGKPVVALVCSGAQKNVEHDEV